jgi:uncharacterized repeat protein (TIGR01451 family)
VSITTLERSAFIAVLLAAGIVLSLSAFGTGSSGAGPVSDSADLAVTKADSPDPVATDAVLTYTIGVANEGPDPAVNVTLTDDLAGGLEFLTATATSGACQRQGGRVVCELGTIASGGAESATIQVRAKKKKGIIENAVSVSSDTPDPDATNDSDTETTTISAGDGTCKRRPATVEGTAGDDVLTGTAGGDVIVSGDGNDRVNGGDGNDLICTGSGSDIAIGGLGNDFAKGGSGNDKLAGKGGGDTLKGNRGRDRLRGGSGNDLLAGGKSRDRCKGGSGRDTERSCES